MSKVRLFLLLSIAVLLSVSAFAVDGVVLINQTSVMAAGGFPYQINNPGSYRLSGNLVVPANTNGININVDNVTLDLNGFSIAGPATCTGTPVTSCTTNFGYGVYSLNDNIIVRNGSISGMSSGIYMPEGHGKLVEAINAKFNRDDGIFVHYGTVRFSTVTQNGSAGMSVVYGVAERNVATGNYFGIVSFRGSAIGNTSANNNVGLQVFNCTYGSNALEDNILGDVGNQGGGTTQNNNNCSGTSC